jgi:hypothetical protein
MHYNFNVYHGRKVFNLNFSAKTDKLAIADATAMIPDFMQRRWVLWSCPPHGRKWTRGRENPQRARTSNDAARLGSAVA